MLLPHLSYEVPFLSGLQPGTLNLRVPMVGEAVQLGTPDTDNQEKLLVTIEPPEIRISREDGKPFQIEDVIASNNSRRRVPVLVTSIGELLLNPGEGENIWSAANTKGLRVYDTEAPGVFVGLIGTFAFRSQSRQGEIPRAATAAELSKLLDE